MHNPPTPVCPQFHTMYDGSKAINQSEQVTFNNSVQMAIQQTTANTWELASLIETLKKEIDDQNILYRHFMKHVEDHHPDVMKEYATTLLVQAKLEQANGN